MSCRISPLTYFSLAQGFVADHSVVIENAVPFMERFDSSRIIHPQKLPPGFKNTVDPYWLKVKNVSLLVDPSTDNIVGYYDDDSSKTHLIGAGFLYKNPLDGRDNKKFWRPDLKPFKEKGKLIHFFVSSYNFLHIYVILSYRVTHNTLPRPSEISEKNWST